MFDNVILDVCIGLVFLYLLYSLLATTINEFIAMIFAYRHRMLEKAIEQMLDGKNYSYYWWDKLINICRWLVYDKKDEKFKANKLSGDKVEKKAFLKNKKINDVNAFDYEKTKNDTNSDELNKNYIKRNKLNKKASLFAANIINHPQYRRKSEQSILFKKPAYLTASSFSDILLDILGNRRSLNSSASLLMIDIKSFVSRIENNDDLKSILNFYIEQANGDIQKFKLLLEDWYDDTMQRVSGWYKRQATKVLFVIGFVLAIMFNVNTIEIVHKLSINNDLREAMAQSASTYVKQQNLTAGTSKSLSDTDIKAQYNNIKKFYDDSIASMNMMMGLGWGDFGHKNRIAPTLLLNKQNDFILIMKYLNTLPINKDSIFIAKPKQRSITLLLFKNKEVIDTIFLPLNVNKAKRTVNVHLNRRYSNYGTPSFFEIISCVFTLRNFLGFLMTALAITLGAPFWFDLLNKFVNIRAGGNKPSEDASTQTTTSKTVVLNQKPAINSFG